MTISAVMFVILIGAVMRTDYLDGLGGYGSNRCWHRPWTPIIQACFVGLLWVILSGPAKTADLPKPDCWPWWQCNGPKETNHPNCKCWDSK